MVRLTLTISSVVFPVKNREFISLPSRRLVAISVRGLSETIHRCVLAEHSKDLRVVNLMPVHTRLRGTEPERRKCIRFRLSVPSIFRWTDESGAQQESVGRTRDLSRAGIFVVGNVVPQVGTKCSLEVHLPPLEASAYQRFQLKAEGKVLRVETKGQESGFAADGTFLLIET